METLVGGLSSGGYSSSYFSRTREWTGRAVTSVRCPPGRGAVTSVVPARVATVAGTATPEQARYHGLPPHDGVVLLLGHPVAVRFLLDDFGAAGPHEIEVIGLSRLGITERGRIRIDVVPDVVDRKVVVHLRVFIHGSFAVGFNPPAASEGNAAAESSSTPDGILLPDSATSVRIRLDDPQEQARRLWSVAQRDPDNPPCRTCQIVQLRDPKSQIFNGLAVARPLNTQGRRSNLFDTTRVVGQGERRNGHIELRA